MSKPYTPQPSVSRFYIPPTLIDDFETFLSYDVPNVVMDFELIADWFDHLQEDYEKVFIRGQIYPDATKSRYANTDNNLNFRAGMSAPIKKGDMLIDENGKVYLLDWEISPQPNNKPSRALRCNAQITFQRYMDDITDEEGYLIQEAGMHTIVDALPCNAYRYDGRPEYSAIASTPGVVPNALTIMSLQLNDKTDQLQIDDEFIWGKQVYVVIDIDREGLSLDGTSGVLRIQAKKKAGGML